MRPRATAIAVLVMSMSACSSETPARPIGEASPSVTRPTVGLTGWALVLHVRADLICNVPDADPRVLARMRDGEETIAVFRGKDARLCEDFRALYGAQCNRAKGYPRCYGVNQCTMQSTRCVRYPVDLPGVR